MHLRHSIPLLLICLIAGLEHSSARAQTLVVLVNDEDGRPLPGAHVSLRDARDRGVKSTAKQDGVFTFEEVPEGFDALQVKASGMQMNGCQWFGTRPDTIRLTMRPRYPMFPWINAGPRWWTRQPALCPV